MDTYGWAWVVWILAFFAIEGKAIYDDKKAGVEFKKKKHGTMSEHLRLWFRTDTKHGRTAWLVFSCAFLGWFIPHIAVAGFA